MRTTHTICSCHDAENDISKIKDISSIDSLCEIFNSCNTSTDIVLHEFVDYWDRVIEDWFYDVIDADQEHVFDLSYEGKYKFQKDYMPEPYWGNPQKCSIVIIDYNPAGGDDQNSFTWREFANSNKTRMVSYVKQHKYSKLALAFPILEKDDKKCPDFLRKYGGRKWWLSKKEWLDRLVSFGTSQKTDCNDNNKKPFAIELCGWHSAKWNSDFSQKILDNKHLHLTITVAQHFILPMLAAIKKSDSHFGVCVGKKFGNIFSCFGKDVTCDISLMIKCKYDNNNGLKPNNKERFYRVYKICDEYIINTWSIGSNRHPSEDFKYFEKELIEAIESIRKASKTNP